MHLHRRAAGTLLAVLWTTVAACGDDGGGDGGRIDAGGVACGGRTCAGGQVCCIDCDGRGTCGPPGSACPGLACFPDGGTDAGEGTSCGGVICTPGQVCCIDCDGRGTCGPPGTACLGIACPPPDAGPGGSCPTGTCRLRPDGACEEPTGPTGNGCCACGADGNCSEFCICAAPDTPVATPDGERPIGDLREGDLVLSLHQGELLVAPVLTTRRVSVHDHGVVRVTLESGRTLDMSPFHPTADGRRFFDLAPGDRLGDARIAAVELVPYDGDVTVDILPASDSGAYLAAGALVGSTLRY